MTKVIETEGFVPNEDEMKLICHLADDIAEQVILFPRRAKKLKLKMNEDGHHTVPIVACSVIKACMDIDKASGSSIVKTMALSLEQFMRMHTGKSPDA